MSDLNKSLVARWFDEVWNQERAETIDELLHPDAVIHDGSGEIRGPQGFHEFRNTIHQSFTDVRVRPQEVICEGDVAAVRWVGTLKPKGSDRTISVSGMSMVRIKDGQFIEAWQNWDEHGLSRQVAEISAVA